jgi:hypothetical protein
MIWRASLTDKTAISRRHPKHIMEHHITVSTFIPIFHGSIKDDIMTYETGIGNRRGPPYLRAS